MAEMGKYCKAYYLKDFRKFAGWTETAENARIVTENEGEEGKELPLTDTDNESGEEEKTPRILTDDDFLYLQENNVVTDGIFKDENIIFDKVTPEWIEFCENELQFEIPVYEPVKIAEQTEQDE